MDLNQAGQLFDGRALVLLILYVWGLELER